MLNLLFANARRMAAGGPRKRPLTFAELEFRRQALTFRFDAGWSSPVARQAHNLKVASSNLAPATKL
jgi:hypothetical protein